MSECLTGPECGPQPLIPTTVETERLLLRTWATTDANALAEIYRQPEYLEHMPWADAEDQVAAFIRRGREDGFGQWAACDRETGRVIGRIGLMRHHDWPLECDPVEVGWVLHRDWWGKGLATEGARASIDVWRRHLRDERLLSITLPANLRSRAVMERIGMTCRGTAYWRGFDQVWYALDREEP